MIGYNLRRIMKDKGIKQAELAERIGMSQSSISGIINGFVNPRQSTLAELAEALGVTIDELRKEDTNPQNVVCPRCGSTAVIEWRNHDKNTYRFRCAYCDVDTDEQRSREEAIAIFRSFKKAQKSSQNDLHVLSIDELLDIGEYSDEHLRPLWFENRGLFIVPSIVRYSSAEQQSGIVRVDWYNGHGEKSFELRQYGSWWRCWNRKPSKTASDSVPWKM